MSGKVIKTISACCTAQGAILKLSFHVGEVVMELKKALEKRLLKKGIALQWTDELADPELYIRIVAIDQGNQFLRWLIPFVAPAVLEVGGQVGRDSGNPAGFHYVQKAQMGLAGGSARGMLRVNAQRVAAKIAGDVLRQMRQ